MTPIFRMAMATSVLSMLILAVPNVPASILIPEPGTPLTVQDSLDAQVLLGTWKVDLRPTPDAPDYFQAFEVRSVEGDALTGTFYYSEISSARINTEWGKVRFAFVTQDNTGPYNTSGTYTDGKLEGMTHSIGRGFLSYWTATKVEDE